MLYQNFIFAQPCIGSCLKKFSLRFNEPRRNLGSLGFFYNETSQAIDNLALEKFSKFIVNGSLLDI